MKTKSEEIFENFLNLNNLSFEKIEEVLVKGAHRPDYLVQVGNGQIVFEVKELTEDDSFTEELNVAYSGKIGEHVRRLIRTSKKQIQYGANQGIPSVLLIYNCVDRVSDFGTSNVDFTSAMYGEPTMLFNRETKERTDLFNGRNDTLQPLKNTSFSAVGRLTDMYKKTEDEAIQVILFENAFAKVKLPFDELPSCIEVHRVEVSREPMSFS